NYSTMKDSKTPATAPLLSFLCSRCGKHHQVKAAMAGKRIKCPQSGQSVLVPTGASRSPLGLLLAAGAGIIVVISGLAIGVVLLAMREPSDAGDGPGPGYESKLLAAAEKVKARESDAIDARSMAGIADRDLDVLHDLPYLR